MLKYQKRKKTYIIIKDEVIMMCPAVGQVYVSNRPYKKKESQNAGISIIRMRRGNGMIIL